MKVLRSLHLKLLCFPSFHLFFPLSLPPHILSLSLPLFLPPLPRAQGFDRLLLTQEMIFFDYINIVSLTIELLFKVSSSVSPIQFLVILLPPFLGFDDPSALLKHELAYCLGQMQVYLICALEFNNNKYYLHCILIIIDCY